MSARDIATATIKLEHRSLGVVLHTLQTMLGKIVSGHAVADFALLCAALYYIDDFPERCHHPKEDEFLFKTLRERNAQFDVELDRLQADHTGSAHAVAALHRALVHYQGGARHGLQDFQAAVDDYVTAMREHFTREDDLLARAQSVLTEADWAQMAAAFSANDDPLFGNNHRLEFSQLYQRIVLLAPRKLQSLLRAARQPPPRPL